MKNGGRSLFWIVAWLAQVPLAVVYLIHLSQVESYSWIVPAIAVGGLLITLLWHWNWQLNAPDSWVVALSLVLAAIALLAGLLTGLNWFAPVGLLLFCYAFSNAQRDQKGRTLSGLWAPVLAVIIPLGPLFVEVSNWLNSTIYSAATNLLKFFQVPHLASSQALDTLAGWIDVPEQTGAWLSWPVFLAIGMLHSALFRRHSFVVVVNALLCLVAFVLFHSGLIVSLGLMADRGIEAGNWSVLLQVCWGLVAYAVFASCERGARSLLPPVPEDFGEENTQTNPLAFYWNKFVAESDLTDEQSLSTHKEASANDKRHWLITWSLPALIAVALAVNVWGVLSPVPTAIEFASVDSLMSERWENKEHLSHRSRRIWGASSSTWSFHTPRRISYFSVFHDHSIWSALPRAFRLEGWSAKARPVGADLAEVGGRDMQIQLYQRNNEHLIVLSSRIPVGSEVDSEVGAVQGIVSARSLTVLPQEPDTQLIEQVAEEFAGLVLEISRSATTES